VKFGYGRGTDHASKDIRAGKMSREEGIEMVRRYDHVKPRRDLERWLEYVGMTEDEFDRIADTFRDPRVWRDWLIELAHPSLNRLQVLANVMYEDGPLVYEAVREVEGRFVAALCLGDKVRAKYRLRRAPALLPTPVRVPAMVHKAAEPTVCYLARWDRRKRPDRFFELVARFPDVRFIAVGRSRDEAYDRMLRDTYGALPNLELAGFVDQFGSGRLSSILGRSWIVVNTAEREGLPNAFIEAAAHRCAILSGVDPDGFASRGGRHVRDGDFAAGLAWLLEDGRWRELGERGHAYVRETFELDRAIDRHLEVYRELLGQWSRPERVSPAEATSHPRRIVHRSPT